MREYKQNEVLSEIKNKTVILTEPNTQAKGQATRQTDLRTNKQALDSAKKQALKELNEDYKELAEYILKQTTPKELLAVLAIQVANNCKDTEEKKEVLRQIVNLEVALRAYDERML